MWRSRTLRLSYLAVMVLAVIASAYSAPGPDRKQGSRGPRRGSEGRGGRGRQGPPRPRPADQRKEAGSRNVTVLTFNTGMFSPTPKNEFFHDARMSAFLNSIATSPVWQNTDVACLQELRRLEDFTAAANALSATGFVHQHSFLNSFQSSADKPACKDSTALDEFVICATTFPVCQLLSAINAPLPLIATCVFYNCPQFEQLSQQCVECFLDHRQPLIRNFSANAERCKATPETAYKPTHGLLLASRKPLINAEAVPFLRRRTIFLVYGYLKAKVPGVGSVYCSHQNIDPIPLLMIQQNVTSEAGFESNEDLNKFETKTLIRRIKAERKPAILLDSTNNGPVDNSTGNNLQSFFPENFALFEENGLRSAMIQLGNLNCTSCGQSNPLQIGPPSVWPEALVDHILVTPHYHKNILSAERAFTENIAGLPVPISESYGVQAVIQLPPRRRGVESFSSSDLSELSSLPSESHSEPDRKDKKGNRRGRGPGRGRRPK